MNILIVTHFQNDGSPTACFIHEQLKEYIAQGHKVRVLSFVPILKKDYKSRRISTIVDNCIIDGIEHVYLRFISISKYGVRYQNGIMAIISVFVMKNRIFRDFKPDIIHAHTIGVDSTVASFLKRYFYCPVIATVHGSDFTIPVKKGYMSEVKKWCDSVDLLVAVSANLQKKILEIGTTTRVKSVLNGFALNQAVYRSPLENKQCSLLQVGNLVHCKHVDTTIKAFAEIKKLYTAATLTIVGDGQEKKNLQQLCQQLDIQGSVVFTGKIENAAVLKLMSETQFYIMISAPEGFGIVYLEAMASGCITMGTNGQGITELIQDGENGFLVNEGDVEAIVNNFKRCIENHKKMNDKKM